MTTYTLYGRDGDSIVALSGSGGSAATISVARIRTTLAAAMTAGTSVSVPTHTVGSSTLIVYLNGLLCSSGVEYTDATETTVTFTSDLPVGAEIIAEVLICDGVDVSRFRNVLTDALTAGTAVTVPDYSVGSRRLGVYLNGLHCSPGVEYEEASSTSISFTSDLSSGDEIQAISISTSE